MNEFKNGTFKVLSILVNGMYMPIGCLTSNSFSEESEMLDTTTRQNMGGWRTSIPTLQSYTISFSGLSPVSAENGFINYLTIQELKRDRIQFSWRINTEDPLLFDHGIGFIRSLSHNAEVDSFVDFTGEIEGYGRPLTQVDVQNLLNYTLNVTI